MMVVIVGCLVVASLGWAVGGEVLKDEGVGHGDREDLFLWLLDEE